MARSAKIASFSRGSFLIFVVGFASGIWSLAAILLIANSELNQPAEAERTPMCTSCGRNGSGSFRLLCWVLTSPKTLSRARLIKKTWGRRCDLLLFMSSEKDDSLPAIGLEVNDTYDHLWGKTQESLKYIYDHHLEDADWFFKADDDTYAVIENVRDLVSQFDPSLPLYVGHRFHATNRDVINGYQTGGPGYLLTRETLRRFIEFSYKNRFPMCNPQRRGAEDLELGRCLEHLGVFYGDSRDSDGRQRMLQFPLGSQLTGANVSIENWLREHEYFVQQPVPEYCSDRAASFHYVRDEDLATFEYLIYRLQIR